MYQNTRYLARTDGILNCSLEDSQIQTWYGLNDKFKVDGMIQQLILRLGAPVYAQNSLYFSFERGRLL